MHLAGGILLSMPALPGESYSRAKFSYVLLRIDVQAPAFGNYMCGLLGQIAVKLATHLDYSVLYLAVHLRTKTRGAHLNAVHEALHR